MFEFTGSERVDNQIDSRHYLPIVLLTVIYIAFDPHGQKLFAGTCVASHHDTKPQLSGNIRP